MNANPTKLAIDFGTSRTKVAFFDANTNAATLVEIGARPAIPTVFHVPKNNDGGILVGDDAEEMLEEDPEGYVVALKMEIHNPYPKRLGAGRKIDRVDLASHLFKFIKGFVEKHETCFIGREAASCILTVPVDFSESKRTSIFRAAEKGGFRNITMIEEPVAAAQAWLAESHYQGIRSVVVCDIGGGTTDFAVVRYVNGFFQTIPDMPPQGRELGGDSLDEMIIDSIQDASEAGLNENVDWDQIHKWKAAFKTRVRSIKERLEKRQKDVYEPRVGDMKFQIPATVVRKCIDEFTDKVCGELHEYLKQCRTRLKTEDLPVLLVGGSSGLPGLEGKVKSIAGDDNVFRWSRSDYAIVLGATLNGREQIQTPTQPAPDQPANETATSVPPAESREKLAERCFDLAMRYHHGEGIRKDHKEACKYLLNAAESGHPEAQCFLGEYYREGYCSEKNMETAAFWYQKSAAQGNAKAQAQLGRWYLSVEGSVEIGIEWIRKSAEQKCAEGLFLWASLLMDGTLLKQNYEKAAKLLYLASKDNGPIAGDAQYELGQLYLNGFGVEKNISKATELFFMSAEKGCQSAQYSLGCLYLNGVGVEQNAERAAKWLYRASEQGHALAQLELSEMYFQGIGVREDKQKAIYLLREAADQSNAEAQLMLGLFYLSGIELEQNNESAFKWIEMSAVQGNPTAQRLMGNFYAEGECVPKNDLVAFKWYQNAADAGDELALFKIAHCYYLGNGVTKNDVTAANLMLKSAQQGCPEAMFAMCVFYSKGIGVPQNKEESNKWLRYAAQNGNEDAIQSLNSKVEENSNTGHWVGGLSGALGGFLISGFNPLGALAGWYGGAALGKWGGKAITDVPQVDSNLTDYSQRQIATSPTTETLHNSARWGDVTTVNQLLDSGMNPNSVDEYGATALHHAALEGNVKTIQALIRRGANPMIRNAEGKTAYNLAKNLEVTRALQGR